MFLFWDFNLKIRNHAAVCQAFRNLSPVIDLIIGFILPSSSDRKKQIKAFSELTANYTKWWLFQWSLSIFYPHRPFWKHYFHYFNFIFSIVKVHLWISALNSVIPSIRRVFVPFMHIQFSVQHFFLISVFDIRFSLSPFHQRSLDRCSLLFLTNIFLFNGQFNKPRKILSSLFKHTKLSFSYQIRFDTFPAINITI